MEVIGIVIGIIGLIIAYKTYEKASNSEKTKFNEEKNNLLIVFKITQKLSIEVQDQIQIYINKGYGNEYVFQNLTYENYLEILKNEFRNSLSNEVLSDVKELEFTESNLKIMLKDIENQKINLQSLKTIMIMKNQSTI